MARCLLPAADIVVAALMLRALDPFLVVDVARLGQAGLGRARQPCSGCVPTYYLVEWTRRSFLTEKLSFVTVQ